LAIYLAGQAKLPLASFTTADNNVDDVEVHHDDDHHTGTVSVQNLSIQSAG